MKDLLKVLSREEITALSLCFLYQENGYSKYRMSKFEEYDLYVKNKDFLVSENVITFNDTDGKLLALKPDVTLSIIKNSKDMPDGQMKVYYNENVYRVSKGTRSFKEIMQVGLECLGRIDDKAVTEVLCLASKSLDLISKENVLEISHLGIVSGVLKAFNVSAEGCKEIFKYLGEKNVQGASEVCVNEGLSQEKQTLIKKLVNIYGSPENVLPELEAFKISDQVIEAINQLSTILKELKAMGVYDRICIGFSVVNDMNYYNGLAFKGFIEGVPTGILSGGQYDRLMSKMGKKSQAIGFAVYLDELSKLPLTLKGEE